MDDRGSTGLLVEGCDHQKGRCGMVDRPVPQTSSAGSTKKSLIMLLNGGFARNDEELIRRNQGRGDEGGTVNASAIPAVAVDRRREFAVKGVLHHATVAVSGMRHSLFPFLHGLSELTENILGDALENAVTRLESGQENDFVEARRVQSPNSSNEFFGGADGAV